MNVDSGWWIIHLNPFILSFVCSNNARVKDLRWPPHSLRLGWGFLSLLQRSSLPGGHGCWSSFFSQDSSDYPMWSLRRFKAKEQLDNCPASELAFQRLVLRRALPKPAAGWAQDFTPKVLSGLVIRHICEDGFLIVWDKIFGTKTFCFIYFMGCPLDCTFQFSVLNRSNEAWLLLRYLGDTHQKYQLIYFPVLYGDALKNYCGI